MFNQHGVDASISDNNGYQAIHWAAAVGNNTILQYLVEHFQVDVNVRSSGTTRETPLHRAARLGRTETVTVLLKDLLANPNAVDAQERTAFVIFLRISNLFYQEA